MKKLLALTAFAGVALACPPPQKVLEAVKFLDIPVREVKAVEPMEELPGVCKARGVLEREGATAEVDFYVTADGRYILPFVGEISYKPSPIKGLKEMWITSLRNTGLSFKLGYVSEDGRFYVPEVLEVEKLSENGTVGEPQSAVEQ
ncbi:MAG: hypothetical protein GXO08_00925 [Aquificae bacterium]|nr:hypothetical protein [Aquificota bacterium]